MVVTEVKKVSSDDFSFIPWKIIDSLCYLCGVKNVWVFHLFFVSKLTRGEKYLVILLVIFMILSLTRGLCVKFR